MGDRANLVISFKSTAEAQTLADALPGTIVLYSHWGGTDLGLDLAAALKKAMPRWADPTYAARIIVSQMVGGDWASETGYGLLAGETSDNEHAILLVDLEQLKVRLFGDAGEYVSADSTGNTKPTAEWAFAQFAAMEPAEARYAHQGPADSDD